MIESQKKVRVRFAPSPTGYLHIGGLRTALYNYLFARKNKGVFILRIEDTDQKRFVEGAVENLIDALTQTGLSWEEGVCFRKQETGSENQKKTDSIAYPGVVEVGNFGPYIQSERLELYRKYAQQLVAEGKAYYCFCEPARLEQMREKQQQEKLPPMYDRYCLTNIDSEKINEKLKEKCPAVIRLKVPKDEIIEFEDLVRGKVSFNTSNIDDQVLLKSDGFPTYHLANVVDDHLMEVTHVLRAEEWLPSTPKHILLYKALNWEIPKFAHLPQLLSIEKKKLSKRMGDVAVEDFIKKGYLKEAIINFVALLGWNPGEGSVQEIFSLKELAEKFDLKKVHKAGAVFDVKKLEWINSQYIKKMTIDELYAEARSFLESKDFFQAWTLKEAKLNEKERESYIKKVLVIEQDRLSNFSQTGDDSRFFFEEISYEKNLLVWKEMTTSELKTSLEKSLALLDSLSEEQWTRDVLEKKLIEEAGDKKGELLWPLRASLTGVQKSPSPFDCCWVLGKEKTIDRINKALEKL
ncbi:MAG: glutamate--tRNA ligase [Candidatus Moranbacteria bacterium]|nr:glutamate--tRNA ligase [Candidatus Moranbacteria bacterium]